MRVEQKNSSKQNKIGQLTIKNETSEKFENFKYLGVILNEDNKHRTNLQERIKNANKTYFMLQKFFGNKNISRKLKLRLKNTIIVDESLTYASETWILTKTDRKNLNIFERKVYRRILGPGYDNEKESWRILTNREIYAMVKKPTIVVTVRINRLHWFGHAERRQKIEIPKKVLSMNLVTTRLRGRQTNRWQDKVRKDGRLVDGIGWRGSVHNREEWKKLLRTARNIHILHMPMNE